LSARSLDQAVSAATAPTRQRRSAHDPGNVDVALTLADGETPLGDLAVAGEHACVPFHGYMEGALQSGAQAVTTLSRPPAPLVMRLAWRQQRPAPL